MSDESEQTIRQAVEQLQAIARDLDRPETPTVEYAQRVAERIRQLADRLSRTLPAQG